MLEREAHVGQQLVEESAEGTTAGIRSGFENPFFGLAEDVLAVAPHRFEQVPALRERGVGEQRICGFGIEADPFQLEEDQRVLDFTAALLNVLHQCAVSRGRGVGGEQQARVDACTCHRFVQAFEGVDRIGELGRVECRDPAAETALEFLRLAERAVEVGVDPFVVRAVVQVRQVPPDPIAGCCGFVLDGHRSPVIGGGAYRGTLAATMIARSFEYGCGRFRGAS